MSLQAKSLIWEAPVPCDLASLPYSVTGWVGAAHRKCGLNTNICTASGAFGQFGSLSASCIDIFASHHTYLILTSFPWPPTSSAWSQAHTFTPGAYTTYPQPPHPQYYRNSGTTMCQDPDSGRNDTSHFFSRSYSKAAHALCLYLYLKAHMHRYMCLIVSVHAWEWVYLHKWIIIYIYVCVWIYTVIPLALC